MSKQALYSLIAKDIIVRAAQECSPELLNSMMENERLWNNAIAAGVDILEYYEQDVELAIADYHMRNDDV